MKTQTKNQEIQPNQVAELLYNHFANLMSEFYEMQSLFLSGIYKKFGSIETANIILCFFKNTHLEILRQREKNLDYNNSLENFWTNLNEVKKPTQKIVSIINLTGIPKETTRRKIKNLISKEFLKINKNTNEYYWDLLPKHQNDYNKMINEEIKMLSKIIFSFTIHLKLNLDQQTIQDEIKSQFSFYWYHFLSFQLTWLKMSQKRIKDIDLILILLQVLIPTLQYVNKNQNVKELGLDKIYTIVEKTNDQYKFSGSAVSATSISEVTGIPRATCIRKLEKLVNFELLIKERKTKRYFVNQLSANRTQNILTKENVRSTISIFSEYLSVVINAITRNQR